MHLYAPKKTAHVNKRSFPNTSPMVPNMHKPKTGNTNRFCNHGGRCQRHKLYKINAKTLSQSLFLTCNTKIYATNPHNNQFTIEFTLLFFFFQVHKKNANRNAARERTH